ncbi:MAG TPA: ribonuclease HI [Firmicutes bacterium]|nr:ribonuclease HI [Bacillota bacterium]
MKPRVKIYTDGACSGNPGPGGWGAILIHGSHEKELSGFVAETTNQRMELMAAIEGLRSLKKPCKVKLHSDSAYLVNAFTQGWIENWQKNGWLNTKKDPVSNADLWKKLIAFSRIHDIEWIKVKGHSDNKHNNRCDALARGAIEARR